MSEAIDALASTTFAGRRFTRRELAQIQRTINDCRGLSLRELGHTVCEHLNWVTPNGRHRIQTCLNALEEMQCAGLLQLPEKRTRLGEGRRRKPLVWHHDTAEQPVIGGELGQQHVLFDFSVGSGEEFGLQGPVPCGTPCCPRLVGAFRSVSGAHGDVRGHRAFCRDMLPGRQLVLHRSHRRAQGQREEGGAKPEMGGKDTAAAVPALSADDPFVTLWQGVIALLSSVAEEFDARWRQRRRILSSVA
jgi:hypothetical protein